MGDRALVAVVQRLPRSPDGTVWAAGEVLVGPRRAGRQDDGARAEPGVDTPRQGQQVRRDFSFALLVGADPGLHQSLTH